LRRSLNRVLFAFIAVNLPDGPQPHFASRVARSLAALEIAWALLFKMLALAVLYIAFFGPGHRAQVTAAQVSALFGQPGQTQEKH
jgi:hypothetical protein